MHSVRCQRWRDGCDSYRPAGEVINPSRFSVMLINEASAKEYVVRNHYSRSYPAAICRAGLFLKEPFLADRLVGVAVFSQPMNNHAIPKYTGMAAGNGVELGRFVLDDDVAANGETWFLKRAFQLLRDEKPHVKSVLSYSDPHPRIAENGCQTLRGHVGTIYQAHGGRFLGKATPRRLTLAKDGTVVSDRLLSKIRNEERGQDYALRQLIRLGAPLPRLEEDAREYVARALAEGPFRRAKHTGNFVYAWSLERGRKGRRVMEKFLPPLPYPKQLEAPL